MPEELVRERTVDGVRYAYRALLQRRPLTEPVIVVGGALQGMLGWPHMEDQVTPVATLVTADLPGMGVADPLPPGHGRQLLCTAIKDIIDDLGVPSVNLFGFSYGAELAFGCAQRNPHRIARLILGGVANHIDSEQLAMLRQAAARLDAGCTEEFVTMAARAQLCLDESRHVIARSLVYRYVRRSMMHAALHEPHAMDYLHQALLTRPSFTGGLSGVPTLVFTGEHDTITSPERQRAFAARIPGSRFHTMKDSDHWVVLERAKDVADLAVRFFTDRTLDSADYLVGPLRSLHDYED
jgi:pimeloyl-ACP methyl ester carboxylesterase